MKTLGLWCQPFAPRVLGLGRHRGDARGLVDFPVGFLAGFTTVIGDLALRALAQRGAPALRLAEEAAEIVDPQELLGFGDRLLGLAESRRCLLLLTVAVVVVVVV